MYRIELAPGEETVFRTIEELAVAVRNGLVTPRCRIYHSASQKWLPIEFHPHYKKALSLPASRVAEASAPRTSGHPPRLETLSFAVAPAARPTPVVEPAPEPLTESAGDHAAPTLAQPRAQAEGVSQEHSVAKRPVGDPRVGHQGSAERRGVERSDAKRSRTENSANQEHADTARSVTARSSKEHSGGEHSATVDSPKEHSDAGNPGADHLDARYSGAEHPVTQHAVTKHPATNDAATKHAAPGRSAMQHSATQHSATEHAATEHSATEHAAIEHSATEHSVTELPAMDHPPAEHAASEPAPTSHSGIVHTTADELAAHAAVEHPVVEHPSAEDSPIVHPVTESPYHTHPAAKRPATSRPAAEHRFASHVDMAAEPSIHAEPTPAPKSKSSYRPDSYLPPSVRVIADDPYVAIAPEPAAPPPVPARPVRASWSMMPAVQETPELPTISYPEFTPAEAPVAERASASRGHRPLRLVVAVLVLAAGGYLARSFYSPVRGWHLGGVSSVPAAAVADRPALPEVAPPVPPAVTTKPSPDRPAAVTRTAPASSGFAAALEPRAIASGPAPMLPARAPAAVQPPAVSAADSAAVAAAIAPPLAEMQMDVPALPGGDSLVTQPRSKSDSAMKRILRAVNGGKDSK